MSNCNHEKFDCVKAVPIFEDLNNDDLAGIHDIAHAKHYPKGSSLYQMGDTLNALYVVYQGKIKLYRLSETGKEHVTRIIEPGDFLGEFALFNTTVQKDYATVLEDAVVCVIDNKDFLMLMEEQPIVAIKIFKEMSKRLDQAEQKLANLTQQSVDQRVASMLLELFKQENQSQFPMNKADIASQLGMSKETLSRTLTNMENQEIILQKSKKIVILKNREALENYLIPLKKN